MKQYCDSPKWLMFGKALTVEPAHLWLYPDLDTLVIALWPLVKAYNWTYRDLLGVIRPSLKRPEAYPCDREQGFATYCWTVLGLHKGKRGGVSAPDGKPAGWEIARELCTPLKKRG